MLKSYLSCSKRRSPKALKVRNELVASLYWKHKAPISALKEMLRLSSTTIKKIVKRYSPDQGASDGFFDSELLEQEVRDSVVRPYIRKVIETDD